jgi:hypothetical protein
MPDAEFEIGRGRIFPIFQTQLRGPGVDSDGHPLVPNYTGWTALLRLYQNGVKVFEKACEWVDAATAEVRCVWIAADTDRAPGRYEIKVAVYDPSGNPGPVYPVSRYTSARITPF